MDLVVFENNKTYVIDEFREGRFDYIELAPDVAETRFFQFLFDQGLVERLAEHYPSPHKRHHVPMWLYLSSQLSMRLHGMHSFHSSPWIIRSGGLVDALWPLVDTFVTKLPGVMKVLLLDRGFINGPQMGRLKQDHDIDTIIPVRSDMDILEDVRGLSKLGSTQWEPFVCLTYSLLQLHLLHQGHEELNRRTWPTSRRLLPDGERVIVYRQQCFGFFTLLEHTELTLSPEGKARRRALAQTRRLRQESSSGSPPPASP